MPLPDLLFDGSAEATKTIALAHGAGAPMDTPFMAAFADGLAGRGFRVVRFEFPYMAERRLTGKKRPPNTARVLTETWRAVIDVLSSENLIIGGKSMGGRYASMVADTAGVRGLVCLGYPFHPAGKPDRLRIEHLQSITTPTLILQGTRDTLGYREEVANYGLSPAITLHWLEDGDHGLKPRKKSGRTERQNWDEAVNAFAEFAAAL